MRIPGPLEIRRRTGQSLSYGGSGIGINHTNIINLISLGILCISDQFMIRTNLESANGVISVALSHHVLVQHDAFLRSAVVDRHRVVDGRRKPSLRLRKRPATVLNVLLPLQRPRVVVETSFPQWRRGVVFLDPSPNFREQLFLEFLRI